MNFLIGEFECKLDAKGRMVIPAGLKRQLPDVEREGLVVNRGFDGNLIIYTKAEWHGILNQLSKLNQFQPSNRDFIRKYTSGATELFLDSSGRVLVPKRLLDYAKLDSEVILVCNLSKVEVWSKSKYEEKLDAFSEQDFSELAESVMGNIDIQGGFNV